jgi:hypothetical protein
MYWLIAHSQRATRIPERLNSVNVARHLAEKDNKNNESMGSHKDRQT